MNQVQKAAALESMLDSPGWKILEEYLFKHSTPSLNPVEGLDSLIKQAYRNGVCQGHKNVLDYIKVTIENAKRKQTSTNNLPYPLNLVKNNNLLNKKL